MTNKFLSVNKDFFNLGLNPIEIFILAQIAEFQKNTNDCFISNDKLAEIFGVSTSTVKRAIEKLEKQNFIIRNTKNIKGGKERHMSVNFQVIEDKLKVQNKPC